MNRTSANSRTLNNTSASAVETQDVVNTSTKLVQSNGIKTYVDNAVPTVIANVNGSTDVVQSNGIKTYVDNKFTGGGTATFNEITTGVNGLTTLADDIASQTIEATNKVKVGVSEVGTNYISTTTATISNAATFGSGGLTTIGDSISGVTNIDASGELKGATGDIGSCAITATGIASTGLVNGVTGDFGSCVLNSTGLTSTGEVKGATGDFGSTFLKSTGIETNNVQANNAITAGSDLATVIGNNYVSDGDLSVRDANLSRNLNADAFLAKWDSQNRVKGLAPSPSRVSSNADMLQVKISNTVTRSILPNGTFGGTSDDRLKHNEVNIEDVLSSVKLLLPQKYIKTIQRYDEHHNFDMSGDTPIDAPAGWEWQSGMIAQDMLEIPMFAHCVGPTKTEIDDDGEETWTPYTIKYEMLHAYWCKSIQQLLERIENLESQI